MHLASPIGGGRPPIVAIVGHIDHGKSTLLDYIRRTNVAGQGADLRRAGANSGLAEAGGITQHLSAYEAVHKTADDTERTITFLDTPGHEAFRTMRSRGLEAADVAVLVVSAEEGVKPQTLEALKLIEESKIPYIVALTKIDKPGANVDYAKSSLLEHGVYLEGMGGSVPFVALSGKTGEGVPELLDLILLVADLEGLSANQDAPGEGVVIEANVDSRRGATATLIVQNGTIRIGQFVVAGESIAPVRLMENFRGERVSEARAGSPVRIVGFSTLPTIGARFKIVTTKKEAEVAAKEARARKKPLLGQEKSEEETGKTLLPLVIKTDVAGVSDAILHELQKLPKHDTYEVRVVSRGVGAITEGDLKLVSGSRTPGVIVGFNVPLSRAVREEAARLGIATETFSVIYQLTEWLASRIEERRPRERIEERTGAAKVLKLFSAGKGSVVLGGRVEEGELHSGETVRITRRGLVLGEGVIVSLQSQKAPVKKVEERQEFGAQIKTGVEPAPGDVLEAFEIIYK